MNINVWMRDGWRDRFDLERPGDTSRLVEHMNSHVQNGSYWLTSGDLSEPTSTRTLEEAEAKLRQLTLMLMTTLLTLGDWEDDDGSKHPLTLVPRIQEALGYISEEEALVMEAERALRWPVSGESIC